MELEDARKFALGLPEAAEQDHHGMPSFRVRAEGEIHEAVAEAPKGLDYTMDHSHGEG